MKIKMLSTQKGARDGQIYPETFVENSMYEVTGELLEVFLRNGWAQETTEEIKTAETNEPVKEEPETGSTEFANMTRKQLVEFAVTNNLEVNTSQKVEDLKADVAKKYQEKLDAS